MNTPFIDYKSPLNYSFPPRAATVSTSRVLRPRNGTNDQTGSQGFTLLEILLALSIFTIIGITTVKHIQQIQNTKELAFKELDLYNGIRATFSVMRYDLSQAFHIRYEELSGEARQLVLGNQPVAHTLFDGRKSEIVFTSLSHRVYYAGLRECEQTEISYFLQKLPGKTNRSTLMKRESEIIDNDLYQGGSVYRLLENVTALRFHYWDEKTAKWLDDWNSDGGEHQDKFPLAIKAIITLVNADNRELKFESEFKIAFPNNSDALVKLS